MDMRCWKKVLLEWITHCDFMKRIYYNIEETDIEAFYQQFISKHQATPTASTKRLPDFLKEFYPDFDISFDDDCCLSSAEYIYVYSLLLHYCCVKSPKTLFHEICQRLPDCDQQCIAEFFKKLLDAEPITKEAVRHAIAAVGNVQTTPPRSDDSFSCGVTGGLLSACVLGSDSPLKTPKHIFGAQRISPSTPKSYLLEERTRELYNLRAQLETERYEKGLLEAQINQTENEVQKLNNDHKRLLQQIQDLKNYIFIETNEGLTSSNSEEHQLQKRIMKEISQKDQEIFKLSQDVRTLRDEKSVVEKKLVSAEKQIILCMNRITELEVKVEEHIHEIKEKDDQIKYLTANKLELEQFITETRSASIKPDLNSSGDCLDSSFLRNSNNSSSVGSPENLGVSVVDVKLREKELENQKLNADLKYVNYEHKHLLKRLMKLAAEFELAVDIIPAESSVDSTTETEKKVTEENSCDEELSCEEHISIFNSCIEKIDKCHKADKNKILQIGQQTNDLEKENENLIQNLNEFKNEIVELKQKLSDKENVQQELEKSTHELKLALQKLQTDIIDVKNEKDILNSEIKSLQVDKKNLNENLLQLKSKLELQEEESRELYESNKKLKDNEQNLLTRLQELDKVLSDKTTKWEEIVSNLNKKLTIQFADIDLYKETQKSIKFNSEQLVIQNEQLKKESRLANTHLNEMRKSLNQKEEQLTLLGMEIVSLQKKNESSERNISDLMAEHKKEQLTNSSVQTELNIHLEKLQERLSKMEKPMNSMQHECILKQQELEKIKAEILKILQPFRNSYEGDDDEVFNIINYLKAHIENVMDKNNALEIKVYDLQTTLKENLCKAEKLTQELNEKCTEFEKRNLESEKKFDELQQQQYYILEKYKNELNEKDQELDDRLKKASLEYETSLEHISFELKCEKECHANKEMELILIKAVSNEAKEKLNEAEKEIEKLSDDKQQLQNKCERLKQFETRVLECSEENNKLRHEIEAFKQQVTQNALRLLEADKALADFVEQLKEQDSAKNTVEVLQNKLKEKEQHLQEIEFKLQRQSLFEEQIELLKQQLDEQNVLRSSLQDQNRKLDEDKIRLYKEVEEKKKEISKEQQDKHELFTSLEQLKSTVEETLQQKTFLEGNIRQLTEQLDTLTCQNTKLQADLVERDAELRLAVDEIQQEKVEFHQKLTQQINELTKKSEQLESIDGGLMEIVTMMETHFNLSQELEQKDDNNVFNYEETESTNHIQKLRKRLNNILQKERDLNRKLIDITSQKEDAFISLATLKDCNNNLVAELNQKEKALRETREQLQSEEIILGNKVVQEVKRLEEDLLNLEKVNDHLTNENIKIQVSLGNVEQELKNSKRIIESLENETMHLKEDIRSKSLVIENLQQVHNKLQNTLEVKSKQVENYESLEMQLKDKTNRLETLEKNYQEIKEKANENQQKLAHYQQTQSSQLAEHKKMQENLKLLQASNDSLEADLATKNKEYLAMKNENSDLLQQQKVQEQQHQITTQKLDEMVTNKLNAEAKCDQIQSEIRQLERDLDLTKVLYQAQQEDNARLNQEIESLKVDKQHLREEVFENKLSLQKANENVTQLIQQIASIRLEKEAVLEETTLLRKQLNETGKNQTSSEIKMKSMIEKYQELERKLLATENELKTVKAQLQNSEGSTEKLQFENKKLNDNQETCAKRIEKLALKLGDSQARSAKLERDNDKLSRTLEAHIASVEALQREKLLLQSEAKSLKERLSRTERTHEQLVTKVQTLEHLNTTLQEIKQKLEASEIDCRTKISKLEKMRELNEEKVRKLTNSLNSTENSNVKLNLEIGALNCQLQAVKAENCTEQTQKVQELKHELTEAQELKLKYEEINQKLKIELSSLKNENSSLIDKLSKASLSLQITSDKCERFAAEMEEIRTEMLIMKQERKQMEQQHEISMKKIKQFESQNEQKIMKLEEQKADKSRKIADLEKEIESFKENSKDQNSVTQQNIVADLSELEELRTKISLAEDLRFNDQEIISQLRLDNQILHTKYQECKQRVVDATKTSEERIKENRLELEGKLEKMKNKMKTLYTEEIAKMKTKQDRELAIIKSEMEVLKNQNSKYEDHTRKLSNQIVRLNDNILQLQKENTILSTKLKHSSDQLLEAMRNNKRHTLIHVSSASLPTAPVAGANIGSNLAMEDEEGEVFNNTYLTDLKSGRMSELMSRDVCVEELKYRNSMLPPHLRSTYAAQFDHGFHEDDLKDGPNSLDDSMSALLSTTIGGTRKKCTGFTHYKRPGPPTPSKNGGRLSFGGNSEPVREVLKEYGDGNSGSVMPSSKTPARFNFFTSRFSMGTTKDENTPPKRRLSNMFKRK